MEPRAYRVTVTATPTEILATPAGTMRRAAFVRNDGPEQVFLGGVAVSVTTGFRIEKEKENTIGPILVPAGQALYGITEAGKTTIVHVLLQPQGKGS